MADKTAKKRRRLTLRQKEIIGGYAFLSPWIIGLVVFFGFNIIRAGIYSFHSLDINLDGTGGYELVPVGFGHYRNLLLEHGTFTRLLVGMVVQMAWSVPLVIFFSLFVAVLLNREFFGRGIVRTIFFLPVIMATPVIQNMMESILVVALGGIDSVPTDVMQAAGGFQATAFALILEDFGMPPILTTYIVDAVAQLHEVIRMAGVQILIFLAALQAIPTSMYEVAQIEGATAYETFWKITFPMVSPLILTNVVYTIIDAYARSEVAELAVNSAFVSMNHGIASAMSILSSIVVLLLLLIVGYGVSKKVFYQT